MFDVKLVLHVYRWEHGGWPTEMELALPSGPADLMVDPFSGQEFKYRLQAGEPLLYSVSRDGVDDDGRGGSSCGAAAMRSSDDGDYVFWPRARR